MNKEVIIEKFIDLYQELINQKHKHWYDRDTLTSYENSYEYQEELALRDERDAFLSALNDHLKE